MRTPEAFGQTLQLATAELRDVIRENARLALAGETRTASGITAQHREVETLRRRLPLVKTVKFGSGRLTN